MTKPKKRTPKGSVKASSNKLARLKRDECDDEDSNEESEKDKDNIEEQEEEEEHTSSDEEISDKKESSFQGKFKYGGAVLNSVANHYKLTLKDILQPAGNKVETTKVLLNNLCGALMQGRPIDNIPSSKKD
jgi:hypothetical protein